MSQARPGSAALALAFVLAAGSLLSTPAAADHVESTEGTRDGYRCDGGWCADGEHHVLDCAGGVCRGDATGFATIKDPTFGDGGWLEPGDIVVGIDRAGQQRAYPLRIISGENGWELVSDRIAGLPVTVTYCPLCQSAVAWSGVHDAGSVTLRNSGAIWNFDLVMYDIETSTLWSQVSGEAIGRLRADAGVDEGPRHGQQLELVPAATMRWSAWRAAHPDTVAMDRPLRPDGSPLCSCPAFLGRSEIVLGITHGAQAIMFPWEAFRDDPVGHIEFADRPLVALALERGIFVYQAGARTFALDSGLLVADDGRTYNPVTGQQIDGEGRLTGVPGVTLSRGEWLNFYPHTLEYTPAGPVVPDTNPTPPHGLAAVAAAVAIGAAVAWRVRKRP